MVKLNTVRLQMVDTGRFFRHIMAGARSYGEYSARGNKATYVCLRCAQVLIDAADDLGKEVVMVEAVGRGAANCGRLRSCVARG